MCDNPPSDDWARFKDVIRYLYIVENRHLGGPNGVMDLMSKRFGHKKTSVPNLSLIAINSSDTDSIQKISVRDTAQAMGLHKIRQGPA